MKKKFSSLIFIYEPNQVGQLVDFLQTEGTRQDQEIISFDYEIDLELKKRGVLFRPLSDFYLGDNSEERVSSAVSFARNWYKEKNLDFFSHFGISLWEILEYSLGEYFARILYYLEAFEAVIKNYPFTSDVYICESNQIISETTGQLSRFEVSAPIDTLSELAKKSGFCIRSIPSQKKEIAKKRLLLFVKKYIRKSSILFLNALNFIVTYSTVPRSLKIYASEYWWHVDSFILPIKDIEISFMERKELQNAKKYLFNKRVRFYHPDEFLRRKKKLEIKKIHEGMVEAWLSSKDKINHIPFFTYHGMSIWNIIEPSISYLANHFSEKMILNIEGTKQLFTDLAINLVLLRASASGQTHFSILGLTAMRMGIPSIEIQHGLEFSRSGALSAKKSASLFACYGPIIKGEFSMLGNKNMQAVSIGSPRFDCYSADDVSESEKEIMRQRFNIEKYKKVMLYVVPDITIGQTFSTYDIANIFSILSGIINNIKNVEIILKLRPGSYRETFYYNTAKVFFGPNVHIAQHEEIKSLFAISDVVISCYSTVILEAMISSKPVILYALHKNDGVFIQHHFSSHEKAGAIKIARTKEELSLYIDLLVNNCKECDNQAKRAKEFLKTEYLFDGHAKERMMELLNDIRIAKT